MSLLNFANEAEARKTAAAPVRTVRRGVATRTEELPQAKLWLNIGVESNGRFINLPNGLPLDKMNEVPIRGANQEWNAFQTTRNHLFAEVLAKAATLAPGGEMEIPLKVRVRRVNENAPIADADNEFSMDFGALLANSMIIEPPAPPVEDAQQ